MSELFVIFSAFAGASLLYGLLSPSLHASQRTLWRLERKVDALLAHSGVSFDEFDGVPESVAQALAQGDTILAIKRLRRISGLGLRDAQEYVDEVKRRRAS